MVRHFMGLVLMYRRRCRRFNGTLAAAPATPEKWDLECKIGRSKRRCSFHRCPAPILGISRCDGWIAAEHPSSGRGLALPRKPLQDIDQLLVRGAGRITKLVPRVRVGKPAQT